MVSRLSNEKPIVYETKEHHVRPDSSKTDVLSLEPIDHLKIFDILFCLDLCCVIKFLLVDNCGSL